MNKGLLELIKERRSVYVIGKEKLVSEDKVTEIVKDAVKYVPSAFNSQSARAVVLFNEESDKLWDITKEALRKVVPADNFSDTEQKMNMFKGGYGTVLFFEDQAVVEGLQANFALYADNFPVWSNQSNGMLQLTIWTALSNLGLGATLQHYNELIEDDVKKAFNVPANWKLLAQMPFGNVVVSPDEKQFNYSDEHVKVFK